VNFRTVRTQFTIYYVPRIFFDLTRGIFTLVPLPLATPLLLSVRVQTAVQCNVNHHHYAQRLERFRDIVTISGSVMKKTTRKYRNRFSLWLVMHMGI